MSEAIKMTVGELLNYLLAQANEIERLKESLHEAGVRNGILVLQLREKDAEIERLRERIFQFEKWNQMTDEQVVMDLKAEIERMNAWIGDAMTTLQAQKAEIELLKEQLKQALLNLAKAAIEGGGQR